MNQLPVADYYFEVQLEYASLHGKLNLYDRIDTRRNRGTLRFLSQVPFTTQIRETEDCELIGIEKERSALEKAIGEALRKRGKRKEFDFVANLLGTYERAGKEVDGLNAIHGTYKQQRKKQVKE